MRSKILVYIILTSLVLGVSAVAMQSIARGALQKAPPDAFLIHRARTVDELVSQIENDPVLQKRYAAHYKLPADYIISYFRNMLVEDKLDKKGTYTVYGVTTTGRIYGRKQVLKSGARVFALRDGTPILKGDCGNPMTSSIPGPQPPPPPVEEATEASAEIQEAPIVPTVEVITEPAVLAETLPTVVALPQPTAGLAPEVVSTVNAFPVPSMPPIPGDRAFVPWWLPIIPALIPPPPPPPPPVPEPPFVGAIALAAMGLGMAWRRRSKRM